MTTPVELADFLLSRFSEDENAARDLLAKYRSEYRHEGSAAEVWSNTDYSEEGISLSAERIVAECNAKRRVIAIARRMMNDPGAGQPVPATGQALLEALALPYVTHDDFRPEWWIDDSVIDG